jgi:protoporphyrinogen IX oxidase
MVGNSPQGVFLTDYAARVIGLTTHELDQGLINVKISSGEKSMLWIKTLHIVFIASWFAGLFYLPRIFVNLAMLDENERATRERLLLMSDKLMRFTTLLMVPALALGLVLWLYYGIGQGEQASWMHAKLTLVVLTIGYHHQCARELKALHAGNSKKSHVWYRLFNEVPVLLMLFIVALVIHKPESVFAFLGQMTLVLGLFVSLVLLMVRRFKKP